VFLDLLTNADYCLTSQEVHRRNLYMRYKKTRYKSTDIGRLRLKNVGGGIVEFLNTATDLDALKRWFDLYEAIYKNAHAARRTPTRDENWRKSEEGNKFVEREGRILKMMARYEARPSYMYTSWLQGKQLVVGHGLSWNPPNSAACPEFHAVMKLLMLDPCEDWDRIRGCECGKWFVAHSKPQRFCCTECRVDHYQKSEEYKEIRRKNALKYYHLHRTKNTR
jgi:hypothetical protein